VAGGAHGRGVPLPSIAALRGCRGRFEWVTAQKLSPGAGKDIRYEGVWLFFFFFF
jgi:hypothetical protein